LVHFPHLGDPYQKKSVNFFLNHIWQFIHQSKALVEFSRNLLLSNFFWVIFCLKKPKNIDVYKPIIILIWVKSNHCTAHSYSAWRDILIGVWFVLIRINKDMVIFKGSKEKGSMHSVAFKFSFLLRNLEFLKDFSNILLFRPI
jgi:hypothetical protein